MTRTEIPHSLVLFAVADPDLEVRGARREGGGVSVCLSHVGLGFRPKLGEGGAGPFSESATALKAHVPHNGLSDHFFVAVLFLCPVLSPFCSIPVWQCNHAEESHTCQFVMFLPYLREHSCVEIQEFCFHGNMTQRLILSIAVLFNNHCWVILDRNALTAD